MRDVFQKGYLSSFSRIFASFLAYLSSILRDLSFTLNRIPSEVWLCFSRSGGGCRDARSVAEVRMLVPVNCGSPLIGKVSPFVLGKTTGCLSCFMPMRKKFHLGENLFS